MSRKTSDASAPKRGTNVSINSDLLAKAKALGVNLSQTLEGRLAEIVVDAEPKAWLEENQQAIAAYNRLVEEEGPFGEDLRTW